jgi:hypothetical protein
MKHIDRISILAFDQANLYILSKSKKYNNGTFNVDICKIRKIFQRF